MVCIYCKNKTRVTNSRSSKKTNATWRRRQCQGCGSIITSREQAELSDVIRVKNSENILEPFSRDKLFMSVYRSLQHRKTALEDAGALTDTIIYRLIVVQTNGVLDSAVVVRTATPVIKRFDGPAAVSYQAYHQK